MFSCNLQVSSSNTLIHSFAPPLSPRKRPNNIYPSKLRLQVSSSWKPSLTASMPPTGLDLSCFMMLSQCHCFLVNLSFQTSWKQDLCLTYPCLFHSAIIPGLTSNTSQKFLLMKKQLSPFQNLIFSYWSTCPVWNEAYLSTGTYNTRKLCLLNEDNTSVSYFTFQRSSVKGQSQMKWQIKYRKLILTGSLFHLVPLTLPLTPPTSLGLLGPSHQVPQEHLLFLIFVFVLVTCCCITNLPKTQWLKILFFMWVKNPGEVWLSSSGLVSLIKLQSDVG